GDVAGAVEAVKVVHREQSLCGRGLVSAGESRDGNRGKDKERRSETVSAKGHGSIPGCSRLAGNERKTNHESKKDESRKHERTKTRKRSRRSFLPLFRAFV